jgi:hypothetical protein
MERNASESFEISGVHQIGTTRNLKEVQCDIDHRATRPEDAELGSR